MIGTFILNTKIVILYSVTRIFKNYYHYTDIAFQKMSEGHCHKITFMIVSSVCVFFFVTFNYKMLDFNPILIGNFEHNLLFLSNNLIPMR